MNLTQFSYLGPVGDTLLSRLVSARTQRERRKAYREFISLLKAADLMPADHTMAGVLADPTGHLYIVTYGEQKSD